MSRALCLPFIGLCLSVNALAGDFASVKLLTPQVGWALTERTRLLWTTDAGFHWNDITPEIAQHGNFKTIADIFFLDSCHGWVVFAETLEADEGNDSAKFELASTTDGGAHWSVAPLDVPDPIPSRGLSTYACIDFADTRHGWMMARMNSNTLFSFGVLMITGDGGKTWKSPQRFGPPIAGPMLFTGPKAGWLAGGPENELYATNDGGGSWQHVSLPPPPPFDASAEAAYRLPIFQSADEASLPVAFISPDGEKQALALFRSHDGGRTWAQSGLLQLDSSNWETNVTGSSWITVARSGASLALNLTMVPLGGGVSGTVTPTTLSMQVGQTGVRQVSFADSAHGWVVLSNGDLVSTADGGVTWAWITSPAARARIPASRK